MIKNLLGPFIDLRSCDRGPLFSIGIEHYWAAFENAQLPRFCLQRTLPPAFRNQFLEEVGATEYIVQDPRQLRSELRSNRWQVLCEAINNWSDLSDDKKCRLVLLLNAMCQYAMVAELVPEIDNETTSQTSDLAELRYLRASAQYALKLPNRVADYADADLSEFEQLALLDGVHSEVGFNAAIKLLAHKAKIGAPLSEVTYWNGHAERHYENIELENGEAASRIFESRLHRASAFIPQRLNDKQGVSGKMELAEHLAKSVSAATEADKILLLENLHPVYESRTKEALWMKDLDLALQFALKVIEIDPYDSRAWLELGQVYLSRDELLDASEAYATAALLGPPSSAIARHMAGICFKRLDRPHSAALFFKLSIDADKHSISPHDEIQALPNGAVMDGLKQWSLETFKA